MDEKEKELTDAIDDKLETPEQDAPESSANDFMSNPDIVAYIEKQVTEGIQKALQGKPPKANTTDPTEQERAKFEKMTYKERLNLFRSNPQAYNKLTKGTN